MVRDLAQDIRDSLQGMVEDLLSMAQEVRDVTRNLGQFREVFQDYTRSMESYLNTIQDMGYLNLAQDTLRGLLQDISRDLGQFRDIG